MLSIDYIVSIRTHKQSGKSKATHEKINSFSKKNIKFQYFTLDKYFLFLGTLIPAFLQELTYFLKILMSRKRPDIIFTRSIFCFGTYLSGKLFNITIVREVHGDFLDESKILFKNQPIKKMLSQVYNDYLVFFIKKSDGIIFNNVLLQEFFCEKYKVDSAKTIWIHNGTDTSFFYVQDKMASRIKLGLSTSEKYALFLGSVSKWHGVELLLEIFKKSDKSVNLLIVGGADFEYIEQIKSKYKNSSSITFIGSVDKEMAHDYICASDICMLPVNNIRVSPGSALKLFDYAACGKPIITQEFVQGYSDIIEKYNLGISMDLGATKTARTKILEFVDNFDGEWYETHCHDVAVTHFDWDIIIDKWIDFAFSDKIQNF